jgi:secondary thiamine-phosphate synthase enzyme
MPVRTRSRYRPSLAICFRADERRAAGGVSLSAVRKLRLRVPGPGMHEITREVTDVVSQVNLVDGLCTVFIPHTSASLMIQENADPSAVDDLERWLERLVPEGDDLYTHTAEGPDDMPAHIKSALTATSLSIPILAGRLTLGTWQGIFLWEHRRVRGERDLVIHLGS